MAKDKEKKYGEVNVDEIWQQYTAGREYNTEIDYYATCDKNERFLSGDQWKGVKNKNLPTPQLNIFKRVFSFIRAYLKSSNISIKLVGMDLPTNEENLSEEVLRKQYTLELVNEKLKQHWEDFNIPQLIFEALEDAVVTGDFAAFVEWDMELPNGNKQIKGDFATERFDGVNVMLGNPNDKRINFKGRPNQPYIILVGRDTVQNLRDELEMEMRKKGASEDDIEYAKNKISSDVDYEYTAGDRGKKELNENSGGLGKATYIIHLKKVKEGDKYKIIKCKVVRDQVIYEYKDTKLSLYPLAWANWDSRKNSYHGQSPMTGYIPNQIFINKGLAIMMISMMNTAAPKVVYDRTRIPNYNSNPSAAIGVDGDTKDVIDVISTGQMSGQILDVLQLIIKMSIEALGGNEVVLGNVRPDNKSAIMQVTQQASIPYENQKQQLYMFVEQLAYIWFDHMKAYYGEFDISIPRTLPDGTTTIETLNLGDIMDERIKVKIDIGPSTYYSEIDEQAMLDNLLQMQMIDFVDYLERLPDDKIRNKKELIEKIKTEQKQMLDEKTQAEYEAIARFVETLLPEDQARFQEAMAELDEKFANQQ